MMVITVCNIIRVNSIGYSCSFEKGLDDVKNKKAISYFLFRNGGGMKVPFNSQILYERVESLRLVAECFNNIFEIHLINQPLISRRYSEGLIRGLLSVSFRNFQKTILSPLWKMVFTFLLGLPIISSPNGSWGCRYLFR